MIIFLISLAIALGVCLTAAVFASLVISSKIDDEERTRARLQREQEEWTSHDASGTSAADKKRRSELMQKHFNTVSKTAIEEAMSSFDLRAGYDSLHRDLEGKPSRYTATPPVGETIRGTFTEIEGATKPTLAQDMNDEMPTFADLVREDDKLPVNVLGAG